MAGIPPPLETRSTPYTIVYLENHIDEIRLYEKEYKTSEAVDAFIEGKKLKLGEYVIVRGKSLTKTSLSTEGK